MEVINAHPRIGANKTQLSALSYREQGYAQQTAQAKEEEEAVERLQKLNAEYEAKFGFKFVVFVNGRSKSALIPVIQDRMKRSAKEELETGLTDMMLIARDRLRKLSSSAL